MRTLATSPVIYTGEVMAVQHALDGLQLRINTAKHLEGISNILSTKGFRDKLDDIIAKKEKYFSAESPLAVDLELGKQIQQACSETRGLLY
jgi:histidyl-tRNA synthetase